MSIASDGTEGDLFSEAPPGGALVSADGRFVAFESEARNLVPADTNSSTDVFIRDRGTGATERVSVSSAGTQATGGGHSPAISADGRFVAFVSTADDIAPGETPGGSDSDVYVRDRVAGTTERVSVGVAGGDAGGESSSPAVSADGRTVAFTSTSASLVAADTNGVADVFVRDRSAATTERVSLDSTGSEVSDASHSPHISAGGDFVVFTSTSVDLDPGDADSSADAFLHDRGTGLTELVSVPDPLGADTGSSFARGVSADGGVVSFVSDSGLVRVDTNTRYDVYVRDRIGGATELISVSSSEIPAYMPSSWPYPATDGGSMSADGRYVAFESLAANLVAGDTNAIWDAFVRDRGLGMTERLSVSTTGAESNGWSAHASLSPTGRYAAFRSDATTLVTGDTNGFSDAFIRDRGEAPPPVVADALSVRFSGNVSFESVGQLPSSAVKVTPSSDGKAGSVTANATVNDPAGGQTRVTVSVNRLFVLPVWIGSVTVVNALEHVSLTTPIITTSLTGSGGDVGGSASWISFRWPFKTYRLQWRVIDGG
ncbi:MAG: PD40 domain-containing protein [Acidimicrobiia bacterium]|nr:PD40 domain-containing protein [Acidimicrobiia bacterium]